MFICKYYVPWPSGPRWGVWRGFEWWRPEHAAAHGQGLGQLGWTAWVCILAPALRVSHTVALLQAFGDNELLSGSGLSASSMRTVLANVEWALPCQALIVCMANGVPKKVLYFYFYLF